MSHITTYKNNSLKNTNKEMLEKSLNEIGIQIDFNNKQIRTDRWSWGTQDVDAVLMRGTEVLPAGLKFSINEEGDEQVEFVGDLWGYDISQEKIMNQLAQHYQKNFIVQKCEEQGWHINESDIKTNENGEMVIEAYRYA